MIFLQHMLGTQLPKQLELEICNLQNNPPEYSPNQKLSKNA